MDLLEEISASIKIVFHPTPWVAEGASPKEASAYGAVRAGSELRIALIPEKDAEDYIAVLSSYCCYLLGAELYRAADSTQINYCTRCSHCGKKQIASPGLKRACSLGAPEFTQVVESWVEDLESDLDALMLTLFTSVLIERLKQAGK